MINLQLANLNFVDLFRTKEDGSGVISSAIDFEKIILLVSLERICSTRTNSHTDIHAKIC